MQFFKSFVSLLQSPNYVTRRQSLKVSLIQLFVSSLSYRSTLQGQFYHLECLTSTDIMCTFPEQAAMPHWLELALSRHGAVAHAASHYCASGLTAFAFDLARAQLLGELLLDRANVKVMMRYVSDARNLQLMMNLLKDSSRSIQFEAFHVFKARVPSLQASCGLLLYHLATAVFPMIITQSASLSCVLSGYPAPCSYFRRCLHKQAGLLEGRVCLVSKNVPVVQVFVANPNKTPEIVEVLASNKEKLLKYLGDFHTDKGELPDLGSTKHVQGCCQVSLI